MVKRKIVAPAKERPSSSAVANSTLFGKIKRISCEDFVTYSNCTIEPTEYLNIITGPNGNGKSTIVAAIVLGLGGEPKLLSRSSGIEDYIKNGCQTAKLKVEVYGKSRSQFVVFQRTINMNGKSEYLVNGTSRTRTKFLEEIATFKIQVGNLCQFLPQDRVQDFAKMNPREILHSTITSVCSSEVMQSFEKLKNLQKETQNAKRTLTSDIEKLKQSSARLEQLKEILARHNAKKDLIEKLKICYLKKMWLELDAMTLKIQEQKEDLKRAKTVLSKRHTAYAKLEKREQEQNAVIRSLTETVETKKASVNRTQQIIAAAVAKIDEFHQKIQKAKADYREQLREISEQENDLKQAELLLQVHQQDLKNAIEDISVEGDHGQILNDFEEELRQLKDKASNYNQHRCQINNTLTIEYQPQAQSLKRQLEAEQNLQEQKLNFIKNSFPDVYTAYQWLQENRHMATAHVYDPVVLELNVSEQAYAKYMEAIIPMKDLLAFTCESKSDMTMLINELCIKRNLSVNVTHAAPSSKRRYAPKEPIERLRQYGFQKYLFDLIEGPASIVNNLCALHNLQNIPIGTSQVNDFTDVIPRTINHYYGGDMQYVVSVSQYSRAVSVAKRPIKSIRLKFSADESEIDRLTTALNEVLKITDALKNKRVALETKITELSYQRNEVTKRKNVFAAQVGRCDILRDKVRSQRRKVEYIRNKMVSGEELEANLRQTVQTCLREILQLQRQRINAIDKCRQALADKKLAQAKQQAFQRHADETLNAAQKALQEKRQSETLVETITSALNSLNHVYQSQLAEAKELANNRIPTDPNFPHAAVFSELPNNLDELKECINEYSARRDCLGEEDEQIVSEHEQKGIEVAALQRAIEATQTGICTTEEQTTTLYQKWIEAVNRVVDALNSHFSQFMQSMGFVGEVQLSRQDEHDFESYGIQIMVQYRRNVALQALSRKVQSGGERAVAIAVYTLAMQHLTHVPFRCVDEINQGMDSRNERKIFEMLLRETTQDDRAQYFFVTPKLLANLPFNERVSVHIVFNGNLMQLQNAFSSNH